MSPRLARPLFIRAVFVLIALVWLVIIARAYLNVKGPEDFVITVTQAEVQDFARVQLNALQPQSFARNIELCGIIFERADGTLGASPPREGDEASCGIAYFDEPGMRPVASFHTHAAESDRYDSEVPSLLDIESDFASGMDGYVATPGGRFWRIDARFPQAILICGAGCLAQDPAYTPCPAFDPQPSYTRAELAARQARVFTGC
ncbi:MAG: DUF4329 domain-containing protein [Erythrobacter sp.]|jgi:hypothetical protein|nr:DUF4329 domain-containing protein [Erythrobacter sp.]